MQKIIMHQYMFSPNFRCGTGGSKPQVSVGKTITGSWTTSRTIYHLLRSKPFSKYNIWKLLIEYFLCLYGVKYSEFWPHIWNSERNSHFTITVARQNLTNIKKSSSTYESRWSSHTLFLSWAERDIFIKVNHYRRPSDKNKSKEHLKFKNVVYVVAPDVRKAPLC